MKELGYIYKFFNISFSSFFSTFFIVLRHLFFFIRGSIITSIKENTEQDKKSNPNKIKREWEYYRDVVKNIIEIRRVITAIKKNLIICIIKNLRLSASTVSESGGKKAYNIEPPKQRIKKNRI
ncbi:MAG: hypothetical protein JXA99_08730 [Candidatus Lokiarchaeota archaeon]|nr:hypothetical protein [Candidatus Lokiarchaeota archaeon]